MTVISDEEVRHLAELSNLTLGEEEAQSLKKDLENILGYVGQLSELNTDGVEPTYQVVDSENVWREDEVVGYGVGREDLLNLAAEEKDGQIKVPKVL